MSDYTLEDCKQDVSDLVYEDFMDATPAKKAERILAFVHAQASRLEALEGEHEAVREIRWRESLRTVFRRLGEQRMPPIDPDFGSDIDRLFRTFDNAERVIRDE